MLSRRRFVQGMAIAGSAMLTGLPRLGFAAVPSTEKLFVVISLRGGMDGLTAVPPFGDPAYRTMRGELALPLPGEPGGILPLDGLFGLHPALAPIEPMYRAGALIPVQATSTGYGRRSHFDAQNVLDGGWTDPWAGHDGWLNRAVGTMAGTDEADRMIAVARQLPLLVRGQAGFAHWRPSKAPTLPTERLQKLVGQYGPGSMVRDAIRSGLSTRAIAAEAVSDGMAGDESEPLGVLESAATVAAAMLTADKGLSIAAIESEGWDTHAHQGALEGRLPARLKGLADALVALQKGLGPRWDQTVVLVVTEFGRTVRANGSGGTDHGTATAALLAGGALAGGRVVADWPGIDSPSLREDRDLRQTIDVRSVIKGVLRDHLRIGEPALAETVFPGSDAVRPIDDLIRA